MTDDDRLAELFKAAASDAAAPAPGFDHDQVVTASRRITARRRSAVIGASFAVFALVGVGGVVLSGGSESASTAAAPAVTADRSAGDRSAGGQAAPEPPPAAAPDAAAPEAAAADAAAAQAAAPPFSGTPLGPGNGGCADRQDPALRAYLEQVLPEAAGAPAAPSSDECLPAAQRYVTVEVDDAGRRGLFGVSYLPPGSAVKLVDGAVSAPTASGGTVVVFARPVGGGAAAPFADRLSAVAAFLAPRL
jgi:hypothetical protein